MRGKRDRCGLSVNRSNVVGLLCHSVPRDRDREIVLSKPSVAGGKPPLVIRGLPAHYQRRIEPPGGVEARRPAARAPGRPLDKLRTGSSTRPRSVAALRQHLHYAFRTGARSRLRSGRGRKERIHPTAGISAIRRPQGPSRTSRFGTGGHRHPTQPGHWLSVM